MSAPDTDWEGRWLPLREPEHDAPRKRRWS